MRLLALPALRRFDPANLLYCWLITTNDQSNMFIVKQKQAPMALIFFFFIAYIVPIIQALFNVSFLLIII